MISLVVTSLVTLVAVWALIIFLANWACEVSCASKAEVMGVEYRYSLMTDCMIKMDGKFEPFDWHRTVRVSK